MANLSGNEVCLKLPHALFAKRCWADDFYLSVMEMEALSVMSVPTP